MKSEKFQAHQGPIWQLSWSDPSCGNLLASCSYDKSIKIWEENDCKLIEVHSLNKYECSVNCISWAPSEFGIMLVAGLSNGNINVVKYESSVNQWSQNVLEGHKSV